MLDGKGPRKACPFYYQLDHLGTPQELTDYSGEIVWSAKYNAYGKVTHLALGGGEQLEQPLRFQGQYFDAESGLHYNRHRYYDPEIGRYLTPDPIKLAGGLNPYQYTPNPTGWVDPLGLSGNCPPPDKPGCQAPDDTTGVKVDEGTPTLPEPRDNSAHNVALFERQRAGYAAQEINAAQPVGSALKEDPMHRAPSYVVDQIPAQGRVFSLKGGDGSNNTLTQLVGVVNNKSGIYEWIVNLKLELTHQRFIPDGKVTGTPNQTPSRLPK